MKTSREGSTPLMLAPANPMALYVRTILLVRDDRLF
jgi:hypothetical protein